MRPHRRQPTRLCRPWDSPGKNTGVGCHFLLQCMKVKRESEVAQSSPTLSDPMGCSLPGSSTHGIFQARVLEWGAIAFFIYHRPYPILWNITVYSNANIIWLLHIRGICNMYLKVKWKSLSHVWLFATPWTMQSMARILEWVAFPFSRGSSQPRDQTWVSCIAGGFFTIWATREAQEYHIYTDQFL